MTRNWYSDQRRMAIRTPPTRPRSRTWLRTWRFIGVGWILLRWATRRPKAEQTTRLCVLPRVGTRIVRGRCGSAFLVGVEDVVLCLYGYVAGLSAVCVAGGIGRELVGCGFVVE